ncbi:MAG: hypothetical protein U9Q76_04970 [candidate division WOR-3 bacterium]|nr:hypothetical protein [candidate division WOR-3 bacterium]
MARRVSLVTENYMISDWDFIPVASLGIRFLGEKFALDVAFINTIGHPAFEGQSPGFPFIGITYNF